MPTTRKPGGQLGDAVAVAHPDRIALALAPHAFEQRRLLGHQHLGAAELAVMAALDLAAELLRHGLLAVADAEHRHAGVVDRGRRERRALVEHRGRAAGEDHALRPHRAEGLLGLLERHDLAIDPLLAHPPGDELGHLRAEIDDQDLVVAGEPVGAAPRTRENLRMVIHTYVRPGGPPVKALHTVHHSLKRPVSGRLRGTRVLESGGPGLRRGVLTAAGG